jgi:hypothetical protein
MHIEGDVNEVVSFISYLQSQPQFKMKYGKVERGDQEKSSITADLVFSTSLLKPTIRKNVCVELTTPAGQVIKIDLLDPEILKVGDSITHIKGLNYDIFS